MDQQTAEIEACRLSKAWLFERHFMIKDKGGILRRMAPLTRAQRKVLAAIEHFRSIGQPVRLIIGKSRKLGQSTLIEADMLSEVIDKGLDGLVIAHNKESSEYIFGICRRFYEHLDSAHDGIPAIPKPPPWKGQTNRKELRFGGQEGAIEVETANNIQAGTGRTPQYIHCSEVSKWERGFETSIALFQAIADKPNTTLILESTFYGNDSLFLPYWTNAWEHSRLSFKEVDGNFTVKFEVLDQEKWNGFCAIFIPVLDDEDAYMLVDASEHRRIEQTLDPYEQSLIDRFGATIEFIKWRRFTLASKCRGDIDYFKQEYPTTWQEAVRTSGRPRFSPDHIDQQHEEDGEHGFLDRMSHWNKRQVWKTDPQGDIRRFRMPIQGHRYVIGVDTAEGKIPDGVNDPDASVAIVLDIDNGGEQVAVLAGQISEEYFVDPLLELAHYFNDAYLIIESNATGKHVCIETSKRYPNERLYHRDDWDPAKSKRAREVGHRTTVGNRNVLIGRLANALADNSFRLHDGRTIAEMRSFVVVARGRAEADKGKHDDHVMALALAVLGMEVYPVKSALTNKIVPLKYKDRAIASASSITGY
jgi:hypothetical protein